MPLDAQATILKRLSYNQIFTLELREDKKSIQIYEGCDNCLGDELYASEFIQLIAELQAIADQMK